MSNSTPVWDYPPVAPYTIGNIYIEPTNRCNLRCVMCPHSAVTMKEGFMEWGLFVKIVEDIASYHPDAFIQLFYVGESLLHPRILDMVELLKRSGMRIHLATNATLLTEEIARGLIDAPLDQITFSFEGTDKETYESIRIGAKYERVMENITRFLRRNAQAGGCVHTVVDIIEMDSTQGKIPALVEAFDGLAVDEITRKPFLGWAGTMAHANLADRPREVPKCVCNRPWRMLAITWDGLYLPCCVDSQRKCVLGDAHRDSIEDAWNGPVMQDLRRKIKAGQYDEVELCRGCEDVEALSQRFSPPGFHDA